MNGLPYYKAYPRDFIEGTVGMSFEVKAAYRLVLDLVYMQHGDLPDDARYISGLLGCSVKKWNGLREALISAGKIVVRNGSIRNHRADKEIETLGKFQDKQRSNRSRPNKNNELQSPRFNHTEPDTEPYKKRKEEPNGSSKRRGTRLPPDFQPDLAFAERIGLSRAQAENEAIKFHEWWPAQPGQKGVKADWGLTWQTWCRKAVERLPRGSPQGDWRKSEAWAGVDI